MSAMGFSRSGGATLWRGRGRGQLPDSSDEDEEVGGARTPSPRVPASPCSGTSGSDEDSDKDDGSDSGSSPSLDD